MQKIKRFIKKLFYAHRCDQETYIEYLRRGGAEIGERVRIFDPQSTVIDATRPFMLKIGNDVQITSGVTILTHGYDWSVIKGAYGEVLGSAGEVVIGNNCFIGMHTTILKGVHIGDNCIIGANSLVNKDIPNGYVAAGNPAKPIMTVEEYRKKRIDAQLKEAEELYRCYVKRMGKEPPIEAFDEFFWLFQKRDETSLTEGEKTKMRLVGTYERSMELYSQTKPMFDGYDEFLKHLRSSQV
ncbi:MAG: acyltransferase [Ruminococcaceae bacterium]|nr:acyltransferase [Oscillospiraceae bacterium]